MKLNFDLTPQKALDIQERDVKWYGPKYPGGENALRGEMKRRTNLEGLDLNKEYDILIINQRIPRGGSIESLIGINPNAYD